MTIPDAHPHAAQTALLAMQHLMVKKGICSYQELVEANSRASTLIAECAQKLNDLHTEDPAEIINQVADLVDFIGGTLDQSKIDEILKSTEVTE